MGGHTPGPARISRLLQHTGKELTCLLWHPPPERACSTTLPVRRDQDAAGERSSWQKSEETAWVFPSAVVIRNEVPISFQPQHPMKLHHLTNLLALSTTLTAIAQNPLPEAKPEPNPFSVQPPLNTTEGKGTVGANPAGERYPDSTGKASPTPLGMVPASVPHDGQVDDVGFSLGKKDFISQVRPGSPAAKQGVEEGYQLLAVGEENGLAVDVRGWATEDIAKLIRGTPGTHVRLTLLAPGQDESEKTVVTLTREIPPTPATSVVQVTPVAAPALPEGTSNARGDAAPAANTRRHSLSGYTGIGLSGTNGKIVVDVAPDSPAAKRGVQTGDILVAVENQTGPGVDVRGRGLSVHEAGKLIHGTPGSEVRITLLTPGESARKIVELTREVQPPLLSGYTGIGLSGTNGKILVADVAPDSPAAKGGVQPGDVLVAVEDQTGPGVDVGGRGLSVDEAWKMIHGTPGSEVRITLLTPGESARKVVSLMREVQPLALH